MEDAVCTIFAIASQLNTAPDAAARSTIFPRIAADAEAVVVLICEVFEVAPDRAPTTVSSCVFALSLVLLVLVFAFASARSMAFPKLPMVDGSVGVEEGIAATARHAGVCALALHGGTTALHTMFVVAVQAFLTPDRHVESAVHAAQGALPEAEKVLPAAHATWHTVSVVVVHAVFTP
jgi:hypothetical protein